MKISSDFPLASEYTLAKEVILIQKAWKSIDEQGTMALPSNYPDLIDHHLNNGDVIAVFRVKPKRSL